MDTIDKICLWATLVVLFLITNSHIENVREGVNNNINQIYNEGNKMTYSPEARDAHFDRELDEHISRTNEDDDGHTEGIDDLLPEFLYTNIDGEVAVSWAGGTVVTEEWNEWLEKNGVEL